MQDIIDQVVEDNTDEVILFLDFRKVFDSVSYVFLWMLMARMKFPTRYIQWVMLLYTQAKSMVRNRGWFMSHFSLGRGVQQGCPLSCHLFNLVSQVTVLFLASSGIFLWWSFVGDPATVNS